MIKTYSEFIKESFDSGYGLSVNFINKKGQMFRETQMFDTIRDAKKFMVDWLDKNGGSVKYFDICSGSNYSDDEYLEVWGGEGGYFYNVINSSYKDRQQFTYKEIKKIEIAEVDVKLYLGI
jgi:hypothetical protein